MLLLKGSFCKTLASFSILCVFSFSNTIKCFSECDIPGNILVDNIGIQLHGAPAACLSEYGAEYEISYDPKPELSSAIYEVQFNDGTPKQSFSVEELKANNGIITHVFNKSSCSPDVEDHLFSVSVKAYVCGSSLRGKVEVQNVKVIIPAEADFDVKQIVCVGEKVNFTNNSKAGYNYNCEKVTNSLWDFGDGSISDIDSPSHIYNAIGEYTVKLKVYTEKDLDCSYSTKEKTIKVIDLPTLNPIPDIEVCSGSKIDSIPLSGTNLSSARWEYGSSVGLTNGVASNPLKIPSFIAKNGTSTILEKEITVTPYNEAGCPGTPQKFKVKVKPSSDMKDIDNISVCDGENVSQVNFVGFVSGTTFSWEVIEDGNIGLSQKNGTSSFLPSFTATTNEKTSTTKIRVTASNTDPALAVCPSVTKEFEIKVSSAPRFSIEKEDISGCGASDGKIYLKELAPNVPYYVKFMGIGNYYRSDEEGKITLSSIRAGKYSGINVSLGICDYTNDETIEFEAPSAPATPSIKVSSNSICEGDTLKFSAEAEEGVSFMWIGPNRWSSSSPTPQISHPSSYNSGTYQLYVTKNNCESEIAKVEINVIDKPIVKFHDLPSSINSVCGSYTFSKANNMTLYNADNIGSVIWSVEPSDGVSFSTTPNDISTDIIFESHGTYLLSLKYQTSCGNFETTGTIEIDKPIQIEIDPIGDLCANIASEQGQNGIELKAVPAGGHWKSESINGLQIGNTFYPNNPGEFKFFYTVSVGSCSATDSIKVTVKDYPQIDIGNDISICEGSSGTVDLTAEPNTGVWSGEFISDNQFSPSSHTGTYIASYEYTNENGCKSYGEKRIVVHPLPSPQFGPSYSCLPNETIFEPVADKSCEFWFDYGDGSQNNTGVHLYKSKGHYEVKMIVTASTGCVDSLTKELEVNESFLSGFTLDTFQGCSPLKVKITPIHQKSDTLGSTFFWQFGSKGTFEGPFPDDLELTASTFDSTYTIRLTVNNVCGTNSYTDDVTVYAIVGADFDMETEWACAPIEVAFQNKTQGTMEGVSYRWDFGDGEYSTERFPTHLFKGSYTDVSKYNIKLTAFNNCGADSITKELFVKPQNIKAQFSNKTKLGCTDSEICFTNNSIGMSGEEPISQVSWDFGNGNVSEEWNGCTKFTQPGAYHIKLSISNACSKDTYESDIEIYEKPIVKIDAPKTLCVGDSICPHFYTSADVKGIYWDFGDGFTSTLNAPIHTYNTPSEYTLKTKIIANNAGECYTSDSLTIMVQEAPTPTIEPLEYAGCSPIIYEPTFDMSYYYSIDYEDNGTWTSSLSHEYTNTSEDPIYHNVNIIAENIYGCKTKQNGLIAVYPQPIAGIEKKVTAGNPEIVTFINTSQLYEDCTWHLPYSGRQYTCDSVIEEFRQNEEQIATLIVKNKYHCSDETSISHKPTMKGLFFPNTFIPGSSNEQINTFNGIGVGIKEYLLEIFDMYGNLLYSTSSLDNNGSPDQGWDGTDLKGKMMPQDAYTWRVRAVFEDGSVYPFGNDVNSKESTQRGTVLLLIK